MRKSILQVSIVFTLLLPQLPAQAPLAPSELPKNLGLGLRELVELNGSRPAGMPALALRNKTVALNPAAGRSALAASRQRGIVTDRAGRVLVTVVLDGSAPMRIVRRRLSEANAVLVAEDELQANTLSVFLPLESAAALAESPGVSAIRLSRRPVHHAGAVTSQGVPVIHSDQVNGTGITGQGITIGILSDSFDSASATPKAADDVATGDLPNMGVPDGRPGLKFLSEGLEEADGALDEGRAMAQIAFDVAPGVSFCFASADFGSVSFAKNIRRLRIDSSCFADVLVDDILYLDEPMFSDGPIAKTINEVVTSDTLAGRKVAYFSSAGNEGQGGYASDLRFVNDADARAIQNSGVDLTTVPARLDTSGGFHNFNPDPAGPPAIYQSVTLSGSDTSTMVLQWDDLFDTTPSGITTDLNILFFSVRGRYLGSFSDDNFSINAPLEIGDIPAGAYRFVIARTGRGSHLAARVRYVLFLPIDGALAGDYLSPFQPTVYGHTAARYAQAVGAYLFDTGANASKVTPGLESFSAAGPVTIAFDNAGNRLGTPEIRNKPEFAAPDCVNTTFFFDANTSDPFFTFCGTSAAAPHAAAAAALLLQASGGPGSLSSDRIRAKFQASPDARDLDPFFSKTVLSSGGTTVTLSATGDDLNASAFSSSFFRLAFQSTTSGQTLTGLTIDLGPAGLNFDPSEQTGSPFTVGSSTPGIAVTSPAPSSRSSVLTLTFSGFTSGGVLTFGIDRDIASTNTGGNSADRLEGAKVTSTFSSGTPATGVFANTIGTGYSPNDGYGLINVAAAIKAP